MSRFKSLYCLTRKATGTISLISNSNLFTQVDSLKRTQILFCSNQTLSQKTDENNLPQTTESSNNSVTAVPKLSSLEPGSSANFNFTEYGSVVLPSFNFAAYADRSPLLQNFIKLGVELYKLEKRPEVGEFFLTLDFEKDVKPYLIFLNDNEVPPDEFGKVITKHPFLFKEKMEDLEVRINYLKSKNFTQEMIANIIIKYPRWLSTPVKVVDHRLGFLQQSLKLKGDDVRSIISRVPSLIAKDKKFLNAQIFTLKEDMEFEIHSIRKMCLTYPLLLKIDGYQLIQTFDYIIKEMKVQKELLEKQPKVLSCRKFILQARHQFLVSLGRAQYNPKLPGYVGLQSFVATSDEEFSETVAKTSVITYNNFLKTL